MKTLWIGTKRKAPVILQTHIKPYMIQTIIALICLLNHHTKIFKATHSWIRCQFIYLFILDESSCRMCLEKKEEVLTILPVVSIKILHQSSHYSWVSIQILQCTGHCSMCQMKQGIFFVVVLFSLFFFFLTVLCDLFEQQTVI